jgi:DNA-3-methyladenine glycosylase II
MASCTLWEKVARRGKPDDRSAAAVLAVWIALTMPSPPLTIALPPGYRPDWAVAYHGRDPSGLCERAEGDRIVKILIPCARPVRVEIRIDVAAGIAAVLCDPAVLDEQEVPAITASVQRMLGVGCAVGNFEVMAATDPTFARLVQPTGCGHRFPQTATMFEALCWAIVGQQVNLTFAGALRRSLIELAGAPHPCGMKAHPCPQDVATLNAEALRARKFSAAKADYLLGLARSGLDFEAMIDLSPEEASARLTGIRGVGPWTRAYALLRGGGYGDVAPIGDAGLAAALQSFYGLERRPDAAEQERLMRPFAPHRSLATAHLWAGWA